ncbi:MAG TPA: 4Fe-4S binding protein [Chloroflexi bacterium]|nr:4Fe-4S binding protein [Chloroflexota bacterium]
MRGETNRGESFWRRLARRRSLMQLASTLALNSYATQGTTRGIPCPALNCYACPAAAFACPIGAIQHLIGRRQVPLYVLGVIGLVGALVGRASCGWFCPFGWFQELMYKLPTPKLRLTNRFNWTRYVVLATLVIAVPLVTREPWFCKLCPTGSLQAGIPVVALDPLIRDAIGACYWIKMGILGIFLAWMSVTRRPFCRWVCPLGALWSPLNPVSSWRLQVDQESCIRCHRCQQVCPVDIAVYQDPNAGACIRCLKCMGVCPVNCISVNSLGWSVEASRSGDPGIP